MKTSVSLKKPGLLCFVWADLQYSSFSIIYGGLTMKKYCFVCVILEQLLRVFPSFYLETGVSNREKVETCSKFVFLSKKKPHDLSIGRRYSSRL